MIAAVHIDKVNFVLIWAVLVLAFIIPFELFLFSYAVIGPLHYLTEINWLDQKNYFLTERNDRKHYLIGVSAVMLFTLLGLMALELGKWELTKPLQIMITESSVAKPFSSFAKWSYALVFVGFMFPVAAMVTKKWVNRLLIIAISFLATLFFFEFPMFAIPVGIFLPTIIHVFLFTLLFMWSGARHSKSVWGYLNVFSMFAVVMIIVNAKVVVDMDNFNHSAIESMVASNFHHVNFMINKLLGLAPDGKWNYWTPEVKKVQVFIAFAYTYHYLNWFSKTSIIKWHEVNRVKMAVSLVLWVAAVVLYYINYHLGFVVLYVLAMLHVILEFPLNIHSITALWRPVAKGK